MKQDTRDSSPKEPKVLLEPVAWIRLVGPNPSTFRDRIYSVAGLAHDVVIFIDGELEGVTVDDITRVRVRPVQIISAISA